MTEEIPEPKKIYKNDSESKEIDTEEVIENLYHGWLGEKVVEGMWVRDRNLKRYMNEAGASLLRSELRARFNTHTHFTVLDEQDILDMISDTGTNISAILQYDYYKYEIEAKHIWDVCDQVTHALRIFLNIPLKGGFREYKENKTKTVINKVEGTGDND